MTGREETKQNEMDVSQSSGSVAEPGQPGRRRRSSRDRKPATHLNLAGSSDKTYEDQVLEKAAGSIAAAMDESTHSKVSMVETSPAAEEGGADMKTDSKAPVDEGKAKSKGPKRRKSGKAKAETAAPTGKEISKSSSDENSQFDYPESGEDEPTRTLSQVKKEFEEEKEAILAQIPDEIKNMFGQIGLVKWGKTYHLALAQSPYDLAPGKTRQDWFFLMEQNHGDMQHMQHLVYWYGAEKSQYYGFVNRSHFTLFDKAESAGKDLRKAKRKFETIMGKLASDQTGKNLNQSEKKELAAVKEMMEDQPKRPEQRCRGDKTIEFKEVWEYAPDSPLKASREEQNDKPDRAQDEKPPGRRPGRPSKKSGKNKSQVLDAAPQLEEAPTKLPTETLPVGAGDVGEMEDIADAESESDASKRNEEHAYAPSPSGDEADEEYTEPSRSLKRKKEDDTGQRAGQAAKKAKAASSPSAKTAKEQLVKQEPSKGTKSDPRAETEQQNFSRCEKKYLNDIELWRTVVVAKNVAGIKQALDRLHGQVQDFSASFIEQYGLPQLMKDSKAVLKGENADASEKPDLVVYKRVFSLMKETYEKKRNDFPKGFEPKKDSELLKRIRSETMQRDGEEPEATQVQDDRAVTGPDEGIAIAPATKHERKEQKVPLTLGHDGPVGASTEPPLDRRPSHGIKDEKLAGSPRIKQVSSKPQQKSRNLSSILGMPSTKNEPSDAAAGPGMKPTVEKDQKKVADWIYGSSAVKNPVDADGFDRQWALHGLRDAMSSFPVKKPASNQESAPVISKEMVARSLEAAVFAWATEKYKIGRANMEAEGQDENFEKCLDLYALKVHSLIAAISGRRGKHGTLMYQIAQGKYTHPKDIIALSEEKLEASFQGLSLP